LPSKPVGKTLYFSSARALGKSTAGLSLGAARGDGFVWTTVVRVPGATALRLHLTGVDLPPGAELYVYNLAGQAFGPYTGRGPLGDGELHTNTVFGEQLLLQAHSPAGTGRAPRLTVAEVGVMGARFAAPRYQPEGVFDLNDINALAKASNLCSANASCVVNAACQSSSVVNVAKDAVASMLFQSGSSFFLCTGALVADTVATSGTCRTLARGNFIYSRDTLGATEGGSSGSPVLNGSGQIVGQLYGACGTNLNNVCDAANNATVDGAFAVSYPALASFLNPGSGTCNPTGTTCTSNSECCSNSCKVKAGVKSCK